MKKIISLVLVAVMICSMLGVTAFAGGMSGDVNGDDKITAVDARKILQCVAELETVEDTTLYDISGDGKVTAVDARIVLQIVAGLTEHPDVAKQNAENLAKFVEAFNNVKENAASVTLVSTTTYQCQEYSGNPLFKEEIESAMAGSYGEQVVNETYTGEDVAFAFPPAGTTCNLTMDDIESIKVIEGIKDDTYVIVVKGESNPTRGQGVGAVASIVTQEDFQQMIDEEGLTGLVTVDCIYEDVTIKATVDKETGNIVEYSADAPLIMSFGGILAFSIGIGFIENWTIAY